MGISPNPSEKVRKCVPPASTPIRIFEIGHSSTTHISSPGPPHFSQGAKPYLSSPRASFCNNKPFGISRYSLLPLYQSLCLWTFPLPLLSLCYIPVRMPDFLVRCWALTSLREQVPETPAHCSCRARQRSWGTLLGRLPEGPRRWRQLRICLAL